MIPLIAAIIASASFSGTLTLTNIPAPPQVYAVIPNGTNCVMIECPPMAQFALPAEVRNATAFVVMATDTNGERMELGRGVIQWQRDLPVPAPIPEPATRETKITTWPKNPIASWGWVKPALENYIHNREINGHKLIDLWYNADRKRYGFRWEAL